MRQFDSVQVSWRWPLNSPEENDISLEVEFSYELDADGVQAVHISDLINVETGQLIPEDQKQAILTSSIHNKSFKHYVEEAVDEYFAPRFRKHSFLQKVSYVEKVPGHKNSKGESAPYVIKSHDTGEILSSHKTRSAARAHLAQMEMHKHMKADLFSLKDRVEVIGQENLGIAWVVGFNADSKGQRLVKIHFENKLDLVKYPRELRKIQNSEPKAQFSLAKEAELSVDEATKEVHDKSTIDINIETAWKWASRAAACYQEASTCTEEKQKDNWILRGDDFRHEALEHASLVEDEGKLVAEVHKDLAKFRDTLKLNKESNTIPYNGTDPKNRGLDPNENPSEGSGGDRPGIWVSPKEGSSERCEKCGRTMLSDQTDPFNSVTRKLCQSCANKMRQPMKATIKENLGTLKKGEVIVVTGTIKDKVVFFVEKDPSLVGIVSKACIDLMISKQAAFEFVKCHKVISSSNQFITKLATDLGGLIEPSLLDQLRVVKETITTNKDRVVNETSTAPSPPHINANIRMADAAIYFKLKGQVPTQQDTIQYIKASISAHTGVPESSIPDNLIKEAILTRKSDAAPLDWSEKMLLMHQWHLASKLSESVWKELTEVLDLPDLNDIRVGIERLFDKASSELQKPTDAGAKKMTEKEAIAPPPKPTDVTPNEEYVLDPVTNNWIKQIKQSGLTSPDKSLTVKADEDSSCITTPPPYTGSFIEAYWGCIPGGRSGTQFRGKSIKFPIQATEDQLCQWIEEDPGDIGVHGVNQYDDFKKILVALQSGQTWVGPDTFGEGTIGFGINKQDVSDKVKGDFLGSEDQWDIESSLIRVKELDEKKKVDLDLPLIDGMEDPPTELYDKWPRQSLVVPVGFTPAHFFADQSYTKSSKDKVETGQIWYKPTVTNFIYVKESKPEWQDAKMQSLGLVDGIWTILSEFYGKITALTAPEFQYSVLDEGVSNHDWKQIVKYAVEEQPKWPTSGIEELWHKLTSNALWSLDKLKFLSPKDISDQKDKLLDRFHSKEITQNQLKQKLKQLESSKKAFLSPTWDGGWMDGPSDVGKNKDGNFPSNNWLPKGQEEKSVSEDITLTHPGFMEQGDLSSDSSIFDQFGLGYKEAMCMLKDALAHNEDLDKSIEAIIEGSNHELDSSILQDLATKYLLRN